MNAPRMAPGPKGLSFLKSVLDFYRDPIRLFDELHGKYGSIVRLQGAGYCAHLITQPEQIKHVLQDNAKNYRIGGVFDETAPVVGRGLTTNNGPSWLKQRRMVQSAFNHKYVASYGETIASVTESFLQGWERGEPLDINAEILRINLHTLGKLLFDVEFGREGDPFLKSLAVVRKVTVERVRAIINLPPNRSFKQAVQALDEYAYEQIASHRRGACAKPPGGTPTDVLSMLMEASDESGSPMTDTELHDEIMTLFFAAYEDVANAIAWTWYLLAQNPEAEERLRSELTGVLGERPPTAADLHDLPYLSMLVNEVLRLYPTTWSLLRDAAGNDEIDGFHIPADSMILMDLHLTHRLPEYWPDPERFDPERFLPERSAGRPRFAFFPFGGGPRQCIGSELALMQIKLILARMTQLYRFTLVSKLPVRMNPLSSLQPRGGVLAKVKIVNEPA